MNSIWEQLYSKNGFAAKQIAKKLVHLEVGDRIPRVTDLVAEFSMGRGTVQGALRLLENIRAVGFEARGHLGTYVVQKDMPKLLEVAGIGPLAGVMPLPYSRKYEGLATGLIAAFDEQNVRTNLAYMRGAFQRMEALKSGRYDFAIMSRMAAEQMVGEDASLNIAVLFGQGSYVSGHEVFLHDPSKKQIEAGMRVGIDYSSPDQFVLTEHECAGIDVAYYEANYMQLFELLREGVIDAAIWNQDELRLEPSVHRVPFQTTEAGKLANRISEAVLVVDGTNEEVEKRVGQLLASRVQQVQLEVEKGSRHPRY